MNPSNSCRTALIFGIGKGFLTNLLFTFQKLLKKRTVLSSLGIMNYGKAYSDAGCLSNTPSSHNLSTSLMMVSLWIFGTVKARPWWGDTPSLNWNETSLSSSHLRCPQRATHISWVAAVTSFADRRFDACNYLWQLTGDLLSYIWHLGSMLHSWWSLVWINSHQERSKIIMASLP